MSEANAPNSPMIPASSPLESSLDIRSVQGASYIVVNTVDNNAFTSGMIIRYLEIEDKRGPVFKGNVDLGDLAFVVSSLSRMLKDDIETASKLEGLKLLFSADDFDKFRGYIQKAQSNLDRCGALAPSIGTWMPAEGAAEDAEDGPV